MYTCFMFLQIIIVLFKTNYFDILFVTNCRGLESQLHILFTFIQWHNSLPIF